jgi:DinB superfamily
MPETAAQYQERLVEYTRDKDALELQREAPARVARLIDGLSAERLAQRPALGKWSIVEILAHLAEDELTSSWRYRQMIELDGVTLHGFDQELWAALGQV